jgi:hypothetical protein
MMFSVRGVYQNGQIMLKESITVDKVIPVIVTFLEDIKEVKEPVRKYRFSDLAGKLKWKGNAVAQQRAIRDEW